MADRPLKVVHVCSAGNRIYGAVQSLMTLAKAQVERGTQVHFLTFSGKDFGKEVRQLGYDQSEVTVKAKIDPRAIGQMMKTYRGLQASVVHTHLSTSSVNGGLAARLAKIPCVATVHGMSGKLSFIFANHLIGVSKGVCDHLVKQGLRRDRTTAVYNGIERPADVMDRDDARKLFGVPAGAFCFGTVARLTPLKGIDYSLEAFKILSEQVPGSVYLLVGNGDHEAEYRARVAKWGLGTRVLFAGYQDPVWNSLAAMDMFLFPSLKEAMGIAVVEALATGLPVISTDVGGLPEVVDSKVGALVPSKNADQMALAARQLYQDSPRLAECGVNAKMRAIDKFSIDAMLNGTHEVYQKVLTR